MNDDFLEIKTSLKILNDIPIPWFVCGGQAVDLFLDKKTRDHADLEIGIFRKDQMTIRAHLKAFTFWKVNSGERSLLDTNEFLELPTHELLLEKDSEKLEVLLNEESGEGWVYRRNLAIKLPIAKSILKSRSGLSFLAPEIVLLYKSTHCRPKDDADFKSLLPHLNKEQKEWLKESLAITSPKHHWIEKL